MREIKKEMKEVVCVCVLYLRGSRKIDRIVRLELRKTRNIKGREVLGVFYYRGRLTGHLVYI